MSTIPKKVVERYRKTVSKFQHVLAGARDRDQNEADTVVIIQDILAEVFGYDKYTEVTAEYAIRGTYCDLAVKLNDEVQYLIEVKAVGVSLKDNHMRQAVDYGANKGIPWIVLTNGITWKIYKIRFEQPIVAELVIAFDFLDINTRKAEDQEKLFMLSKKGIGKEVREDFYHRRQSVNRFVIGALLQSDPMLNGLKRDLRKLSRGMKIDTVEIKRILESEVLKRDVIEGEQAKKAAGKVRKLLQPAQKSTPKPTTS